MEYPGVALITGAGGTGIGNATAHAFVRAGCTKLVITDINPASLASTEASLRSTTSQSLDILSVPGDISSQAFIAELFERVASHFGHLDYAVNSAGVIGDNLPTDLSSVEAFDKVNGVNYRGLWMCVREEIKMMKKQEISQGGGLRGQRGSIVNIASQLGIVGRPNASSYCAGKAAVIGLTRCDAVDASPFRIRVNAVCPGIIDTPMVKPGKDAMTNPPPPSADPTKRVMDLSTFVAIAPMNRMGEADEIADVVVFLSGEKASFVQGAAWVVDGGYTIN